MAKSTEFTFRSRTYKSLQDYCKKQHFEFKEVASFSGLTSNLVLTTEESLKTVKRHDRFFAMSGVSFLGLTFDSLEHLFFSLELKYKNYLDRLDSIETNNLVIQLEKEYVESGKKPYTVNGNQYLTIQSACFDLGITFDKRMLEATHEQLELYFSDYVSSLAYYKVVRKSAIENKKPIPKFSKLTLPQYLSVDGKPPTITKVKLPPVKQAVHHSIPELDFSGMPPIDYSKPSVEEVSKYTFTFNGISYKTKREALATLNVSESTFGNLKQEGYTSDQALYILLNRQTLISLFPISFTGRRYPKFRSFLDSLRLLVNDINADLQEGFITNPVDYLRRLEEARTDRKIVTKRDKSKPLVTVKAVSSKRGRKKKVVEDTSTYITYKKRKYKTLEQLELKYRMPVGTLVPYMEKYQNNVDFALTAYREDKRLAQIKQAKKKRKENKLARKQNMVKNEGALFYRGRTYGSIRLLERKLRIPEDALVPYFKGDLTGVDAESAVNEYKKSVNNGVLPKKTIRSTGKPSVKSKTTDTTFHFWGTEYKNLHDFSTRNNLTLPTVYAMVRREGSIEAFLKEIYYFEGSVYLSITTWSKGIGVNSSFLRDLIALVGVDKAKEVLSSRLEKVA